MNSNTEGATWNNDTAAAYLGCTPGTLRVWVSKRRVPFVRVGRLVRFRKSDLDKWLDKNLQLVAT
ncbi:MAG: helix-turn-helix domain-containing protein [bacterium]|nr:helix-turn-helix domain-containing protein [bacterium]